VETKKPSVLTPPDSADAKPSTASVPAQRVFGSAKDQIVFKKGWDAPMTKRELDDFLGES
jgi:hypothetical protein